MPKTRLVSMIRNGVLILPGPHGEGADDLVENLEGLASAYLQDIRHVVLVETENSAETSKYFRCFQALLASRGLRKMALRKVGAEAPIVQKIKKEQAEDEEVSARRSFLRLVADAIEAQPEQSRLAELQAVSADLEGALFAATPEIDPHKCTGCDACLRVCPQDILTQINDGDGKACYAVASASCDACGLCKDICPTAAIRISTMVSSPADIPLAEWVCDACRAPVHAPQIGSARSGLCDSCQRGGHHKKLFQVIT